MLPPINIIKLPQPRLQSGTSIEEALWQRRSIREYSENPLTLSEISQLLWATQGITNREGFRTAPSAGALFPLEVYLVAGKVENLPHGIYKYHPKGNELALELDGDMRSDLCKAALEQDCILKSPASFIITAVFERVTIKYGNRGIIYVHIEAGHAAQNIHLQAEALKLGTVVVGAFYDEEVKKVLHLPDDEQPLCIMPIGRK
ncbi:MAG: SagB/ThcOx family dehydrogenase [Bacteroidota bacterium]|nr:SagB/ThcOx family dehydrogenase [Bacteroidota bacterium]